MKNFFYFILFLSTFGFSQNHIVLSQKICDSLKYQIKQEDSSKIFENQMNVFTYLLQKEAKKIISPSSKNFYFYNNTMNTLLINTEKDLLKECSHYLALSKNPYHFLPLTYVVDFDSLITIEEGQILHKKAEEISNDNKIDIRLLIIDDFFPYKNIDDFSNGIFENWDNVFGIYKGVILIFINKNEEIVKISTSESVRKILTDEECQKIIDDFFVPNFKNGKYYHGINDGLDQIKNLLK